MLYSTCRKRGVSSTRKPKPDQGDGNKESYKPGKDRVNFIVAHKRACLWVSIYSTLRSARIIVNTESRRRG